MFNPGVKGFQMVLTPPPILVARSNSQVFTLPPPPVPIQVASLNTSDSNNNKNNEVVSKERCWEIINSIANRTCLPSHIIKDVPTHLAMTGVLISTSGFMSKKANKMASTMIAQMNGTVTANYTAATTHIVSTHGLTDKVILARKRKLPVMNLQWVSAVWNACENNPYVHGKQPEFQIQKYNCPLFHNVIFCISEEVSQENRMILTNLITKHDGKVISEVIKKHTDILICKHSEEQCFILSKELEIPAVSAAWVTVSILDNIIHDFSSFQIPSFRNMTLAAPNKNSGKTSIFYRLPSAKASDSWKSVPPIDRSTKPKSSKQKATKTNSPSRPIESPPRPLSPPDCESLCCYFEVSSDEELDGVIRSSRK